MVTGGNCCTVASGHSAVNRPLSWVAGVHIDLGVDRQRLGNRWEVAMDGRRSADMLAAARVEPQGPVRRLAAPVEQPLSAHVHPRLCERCLLPSYEPSTPCGSP